MEFVAVPLGILRPKDAEKPTKTGIPSLKGAVVWGRTLKLQLQADRKHRSKIDQQPSSTLEIQITAETVFGRAGVGQLGLVVVIISWEVLTGVESIIESEYHLEWASQQHTDGDSVCWACDSLWKLLPSTTHTLWRRFWVHRQERSLWLWAQVSALWLFLASQLYDCFQRWLRISHCFSKYWKGHFGSCLVQGNRCGESGFQFFRKWVWLFSGKSTLL